MGKRFVVAAFIATALTGACAHHGGGGDDGDGGVTYSSVRVTPDPVTLVVPLGGSATQDYVVLGTDTSGEHDVTANCTLGVDGAYGSFTNATFTAVPHGGITQIVAVCGTTTGSANVQINLVGSAVVGNAPSNSEQIFGAATVGTNAPTTPAIEYPIDKAVAPLNIPPIEVQYTKATNDLFHINLKSTYAAIDVYTTAAEQTFSPADWLALSNTAVGDKLVITVEGLVQANPATKYASAPTTFNLSHDTIDTSAIYWWASSQGSIMTQTFGATNAPTLVKGNCSGCHSLSRAGSRIGYSRCVNGNCNGGEWVGFMHYNTTTSAWDEVVNADAKQIPGTYTTFAPKGNPFPDDTQSVAIVTSMTGTLNLYDPDTGTAVASNLSSVTPIGGAAAHSATMPDWSSDGTQVTFASAAHNNSVDVQNSSIAIMSYAYTGGAHTFGTPTVLVQQPITVNGQSYANLFFPSFSPDGQQIVFNAARSNWRNLNAGQGASPGQRLMLVSPTGGPPIDLLAMNGGTGDHNVTWPHWAPGASTDYYWVVFSSEANYGHRLTQANTASACKANGVLQCKQIWIGAISKAALMAGTIDPSSPGVWVPGQDIGADNISPYWTVPAGLF